MGESIWRLSVFDAFSKTAICIVGLFGIYADDYERKNKKQ